MRTRLFFASIFFLASWLPDSSFSATPEDFRLNSATHKPINPALDLSDVTLTITPAQVPALNASKITAGAFDPARIPSLDAAKVTTGAFDTARIPALDWSKITTGKPTSIGGYGIVLLASDIPALDVAKITTGTFASSFIPALDVSKITTGTFASSFIPALDWSKIATGKPTSIGGYGIVLLASDIPALDFSKITTGIVPKAQLPAVNAYTDAANSFTPLQSFNSIASSSITTSQLANAGAPTVTPIGTNASTTWSYKIVAKLSDGTPSAASPAGSTAIGEDVLNSTDKNSLTWSAVTGAASYDVYRTAVGVSPSTTGKIANVSTNSYIDAGAAGDSTTAPSTNVTGNITLTGPFNGVTLSLSGNASVASLNVSGTSTLGTTNTGQLKPSKIGDRTIYASAIATLNSNVLTGGGTDATTALQAGLDTLDALGGGTLVLDGAALTSNTLYIGDNITIDARNPAAGIYLADNSNCHILRNKNYTGGAWPNYFGRTFNKNIRLLGGTYNGNFSHQTATIAGGVSGPSAGPPYTVGFFFAGVSDLLMDGVTISNARIFAALLAYLDNPTILNQTSKWDSYHAGNNNDGLHFWGPITGTNTVRNVRHINGSDDAVALSYAEPIGYTSETTLFNSLAGGVNTIVDGLTVINGAGPVVVHGVNWSNAAITARMGNITIRNIDAEINTAQTVAYALYAAGPWDRLHIENYKLKYPATLAADPSTLRGVHLNPTNTASVIEFVHWQVYGSTDDTSDFILFGGNSSAHVVNLEDFHVTKTLGSPSGNLFAMSLGSDPSLAGIDVLTVKDCDITGYTGLIWNGRATNKLASVHADNNTLNSSATLFGSGTNAPAALTNGQFSLDYLTGRPISPFVLQLQTDLLPAGVPASATWQEIASQNFGSMYGTKWQFNLTGVDSVTTRFSLAAGNNSTGPFVMNPVMSLFTGGGAIVGTSTTNPGLGVILADNGYKLPSLADGSAVNGTLYKSTTQSGPVYKDASANVYRLVVGDYVESARSSGSALALTTGTAADVTSISLPAGEWDVEGSITYILGSSSTVVTHLIFANNSASATIGPEGTYLDWGKVDSTGSGFFGNNIPVTRYVLGSTTTIYLVADAVFSGSTLSASGKIRARRIR